MAIDNVTEIIRSTAMRLPDQAAQRYWNGSQWTDRSYRDLWNLIQATARGLRDLGVRPGDRVGLMAKTCPAWVVADYAVLCVDAVTVPIYPSVPIDQALYIVEDAGIQWVIADNDTLAEKLPHHAELIMLEPRNSTDRSLASLAREGDPVVPTNGREALATLVYTSGTTGLPKGVMLTHGNLLANVDDLRAVVHEVPDTRISPEDVALSFLPLSHILERTCHNGFLAEGATLAYARSTDHLAEDLAAISPTLMVAVPRVMEKVYARVQNEVSRYPMLKQRIFEAGVRTGEQRYQILTQGHEISAGLARKMRIYDRLVYQKVRAGVGGRLRFVISGGAPLAPEIGRFFFAMGIPVLEGYGLTETAPVLSVNCAPLPRYGTVGKPLPHVEIRLAEDGEILARGPNVARGYWNLPEATAEAFQDGWFHTGDVGELTDDGFLRVTDRKKYLIVLSTGKKVAPQAVEQKLTLSPVIEQAVVLGNRRKFVSALLYLNPMEVRGWAYNHHKSAHDYALLLNDPELLAYVQSEVERTCADLALFERPKQFRFLPTELSEQGGDLTPSLKVKLPAVEAKYESLIEAMYQDSAAPPPLAKGEPRTLRVLYAIGAGVALALIIRYVVR